jgi:cellobiose phosphorylase
MEALAERKGDANFAAQCRREAATLAKNIEDNAWDGDWYLRAFFDNGNPLGSAANSECKIDSIPQSWSIISGAGNNERSIKAMDEVDKLLIDRKNNLVKIFDPPFEKGESNPGYIQGYVPGVRENGGQYTHAAVWSAMAFAMLKDKRAWEMLDIINPIKHADTAEKSAVYKVEPYVLAADVYSSGANAGRGGWTWYTGSASWMYQFIVGNLLGLKLEVDRLYFEPLLKEEWHSYKIHYRYRETFYHITVNRTGPNNKVLSLTVDGAVQNDGCIKLVDDRMEHNAELVVG